MDERKASFMIFSGDGGGRGRGAGSRVSRALFIRLRLLADVGEEANCWGSEEI